MGTKVTSRLSVKKNKRKTSQKCEKLKREATLTKNIATGETSQAITSFDYFHFFRLFSLLLTIFTSFDYFHFF